MLAMSYLAVVAAMWFGIERWRSARNLITSSAVRLSKDMQGE